VEEDQEGCGGLEKFREVERGLERLKRLACSF